MNTITAEELRNLRQTDKENLIIINVLDPVYFEKCRIAGSINMPIRDKGAFQKEAGNLDVNKNIIVYCSNYACRASAKAYDALKETGYFAEEKLFVYEGGVQEWHEKGFETEGTEC